MKKIFKLLGLIGIGLLILIGCRNTEKTGKDSADQPTYLSFATSGQGGTFYVAGSGMASYINSNVENLEVNAEVTQGVVENVRLMAFDESEMGFSYGSTAYKIMNGLDEFEDHPYDGIRALANIHDGALNFVTLENKKIDNIRDLEGKKISIGPEGSGSADVAEDFLRSIGLWDKIKIQNLGFEDSASSLKDGHLDAFIIGGTTPVPTLIELEATHPMVLLPVEQDDIDKFLEDHPYHISYTIPEDGYSSLTEPVETVGYTVLWVIDESIDEEIVYNMLEAVFSEEGKQYLINIQKAFKEMSPGLERYETINLKLHPGAEAFYEKYIQE